MNETTSKTTSVKKALMWKMLERFFVQFVNLVVQIILARLMLPAEFGMLAMIVAVTNYLAILVQTGLSTAIVQKKDLDSTDVSTLFWSSLFIALVLYVALFFASPLIVSFFKAPSLLWPLRALGTILFFNAIHSVQEGLYMRDMRFKDLFFFSFASVLLSGAIGIILAIRGFGLWALVVHNLVNILVFDIVVFIKHDYFIRFTFSFKKFVTIYKFSSFLILSGIVSGAHDLVRTAFIGRKYTAEDLGYYDKAMTYSGYISNVSINVISSVLLPFFSKKQDESEALLDSSRKSIRLTSLVMFPILIGIASISEPLIVVLLTETWRPASVYLEIFCILRLVGCLEAIDKQVYFSKGNSKVSLFFELSLLVANIVVLVSIINNGTLALAIGATAVELLFFGVICAISKKVYGYGFLEHIKDILSPLLSSIFMYVTVRGTQQLCGSSLNIVALLLISIVIGASSYFVSELLLKDETFITLIKSIKRRVLKRD